MVAAQKIPQDHAILQCEICRSHIGIFKPEDLRSPIDASMFKSIDEFHGFPPPFPATTDGRGNPLTWEFARCPYCRVRPFMEADRVKTPYGFIKVGDTKIPRPRTAEDDNQEKINIEWQKEQDASLTFEERNQEIIDRTTKEIHELSKESATIEDVLSAKTIVPESGLKIPLEETDFKDPEHIENFIIIDEDIEDIKDVKPQTDRTGSFKADKSLLKGRCRFCGKKYKRDDFKKKHENKCPDNPKNQKKDG